MEKERSGMSNQLEIDEGRGLFDYSTRVSVGGVRRQVDIYYKEVDPNWVRYTSVDHETREVVTVGMSPRRLPFSAEDIREAHALAAKRRNASQV